LEKDWVSIYSSNTRGKIEILKAKLEEHEIQVVLMSKKDSMYQFGDMELFVTRDDVIRAKQILTKIID